MTKNVLFVVPASARCGNDHWPTDHTDHTDYWPSASAWCGIDHWPTDPLTTLTTLTTLIKLTTERVQVPGVVLTTDPLTTLTTDRVQVPGVASRTWRWSVADRALLGRSETTLGWWSSRWALCPRSRDSDSAHLHSHVPRVNRNTMQTDRVGTIQNAREHAWKWEYFMTLMSSHSQRMLLGQLSLSLFQGR